MATVGAPWGLQGWVKVWSATSPPDNLLVYRQFAGCSRRWQGNLDVEQCKRQGRFLAFKFRGFDNRTDADKLKGIELRVRRDQLPVPEIDEYYWHDLVGLRVETVDGVLYGHIVEMVETGANDVMVVEGDRQRWIPFLIDRVVLEVDLDKRVCKVDWDADF